MMEQVNEVLRLDRFAVVDTGEPGVVLYADDAVAFVQLDSGYQDTFSVEDLRVLGH